MEMHACRIAEGEEWGVQDRSSVWSMEPSRLVRAADGHTARAESWLAGKPRLAVRVAHLHHNLVVVNPRRAVIAVAC